MDPHPMDHMPPSLMPTIPNILSSAYASRMDWIRNRGIRPTPPTPPPVVTPSGEPGPGSRAIGVQYGPAVIKLGPDRTPIGVIKRLALSSRDMEMMSQAEIDDYNRQLRDAGGPLGQMGRWGDSQARQEYEKWLGAGNTVQIPRGDPKVRDQWLQGLAGMSPLERAAWLKEIGVASFDELLKMLEGALAAGGLTDAEAFELLGQIEGIRAFRDRAKEAPVKPAPAAPVEVPAEAPAPAAPVAPAVAPGQLGHRMPWNAAGIGPANERNLAKFILKIIEGNSKDYGLYQMLTGKVFELRDFARKLWELHEEGDAFAADDLLKDAIENSDPKLAQTLKDIEEWTRQAEPESTSADLARRRAARGAR